MSSPILATKALAIPADVRESYLLRIPETDLHAHLCRLLENMDSEARCEITHGRDEYGRDIVLRRSSAFGQEYIAIVVKRGNASGSVSGRTAGPVDEIISQVNQSVVHRCRLKEIEIASIRISGAWIMFFGRLTHNAVKRIMAEADGLKFKPFPIGWLADAFARHYPEVFFAGEASTYLQDKVIEFETHHDLTRRPGNLSDWYVDPSVAITQIYPGTFSERLSKALKLRRLSYQQFLRELESRKHFVLSAAPGFGKSTLLRKIALDIYREALSTTASLGTDIDEGAIKIPILVPATEMAEFDSTDSFLDRHLPSEPIRSSFSVECLLVDALDELPQNEQLNTLAFADKLANRLDCSMIVSARPVHVVRTLADQSATNLPVVQLLPFGYSQAMKLIDRMVSDPSIVDILREGLSSLRSHMALSPLSVSLLLDIAEAEREVPGTIGEIFDQYIDIALGRYDIERGLEVVFQFFIKKRLLSELAWFEFFEKDRLAIHTEEFDGFLQQYFEERRFPEDMIPRMKADIDRSGLVRFGEKVNFTHRAFLDFFVANYVDDHSTKFPRLAKWLADIYFNDKWSDVGFYFFARKREVLPEFLTETAGIDRDDVDYHARKYMIGRLLQAGWLSPSQIKIKGIEIGLESAPRLFEMISREIKDDAPLAMPYGVMAALSESSYSSRTLHQEVSEIMDRLTQSDCLSDFRKAINLLWANRTRIPTAEAGEQADQVLDMMARLEKRRELPIADKVLCYLLIETVVEDDKERQRAISRRFRRLARSQPRAISKLLEG